MNDSLQAHGIYSVYCTDLNGNLKWKDIFDNLVTIAGRTFALDAYLSGSSYTVNGPFMGLVSSVSYTGIATSDTMTSHAGWTEYTGYSGGRKLVLWSAAASASKSTSAPCSFTITAAGTVKGAFIDYGTGADTTAGDSNGVLYSVGLFNGGDKVVSVSDVLNISYTASL